MADPPVLIAPDNRLLGWSLTDLTLYGGQPTPGLTIGRAPADGVALTSAPAPGAGSAAPPVPESEVAAGETVALLHDAANQPAEQLPAPAPSAFLPAAAAPATAEPASLPHAIGSGSFLQDPIATPLQAVADDGHGTSGNPTGVSASAPVAVVDTLGGVAHTGGEALDTLAPVVDLAALPFGAAVGLTDTIDAVVGRAAALPQTLLSELGTLGHGTDAAVETIGLDGFGGTDPIGGLTTLVGMVESADAFHLGDAVAPATADAAPASILDALAADALPSSLLGDEHGGVDHALDDHGIHLGL